MSDSIFDIPDEDEERSSPNSFLTANPMDQIPDEPELALPDGRLPSVLQDATGT